MPKREKINNLKSVLGIEDNRIAENYLIKAEWDEEKAKELYYKENPKT